MPLTDLPLFISAFENFTRRGVPDQTEIFAWYLHESEKKDRFSSSDLGACFDSIHIPRPANISATLAKLASKKPSRIIRDKSGYRLSAVARQDLEKIAPLRRSTPATTRLLADLLKRVGDKQKRIYLEEAISCFGNSAYRSAIVMTWNLAYSEVVDRIYEAALEEFNSQIGTFNFKRKISNRSDFSDLKESDVIKIARAARIISGETLKLLEEKLGKRNSAAHPSGKVITVVSAEDFISDLVENIVLNPSI